MLATIQNSGMFGNVQGFSPSKQIVIGHESLSSILCAGRVPSIHARARARQRGCGCGTIDSLIPEPLYCR